MAELSKLSAYDLGVSPTALAVKQGRSPVPRVGARIELKLARENGAS